MTKTLKATRHESGTRHIKETSIIVPDHVYDLLKDFDIEIIDQEVKTKTCSIYLMKDGEDQHSITFDPKNNESYVKAIKQLVDNIQEEKSI